MSTVALVLGGAACAWDDLAKVREIVPEPDIYVMVNFVGTVWPGTIHHWVSYHPALLKSWIEKRRANKLPDALNLWTSVFRLSSEYSIMKQYSIVGGSSGMLGAFVASDHADKVILAGIPMDHKMPHWYPNKTVNPWKDGLNYREHWKMHEAVLKRKVRSVSGFTLELLGEPTEEWLKC